MWLGSDVLTSRCVLLCCPSTAETLLPFPCFLLPLHFSPLYRCLTGFVSGQWLPLPRVICVIVYEDPSAVLTRFRSVHSTFGSMLCSSHDLTPHSPTHRTAPFKSFEFVLNFYIYV